MQESIIISWPLCHASPTEPRIDYRIEAVFVSVSSPVRPGVSRRRRQIARVSGGLHRACCTYPASPRQIRRRVLSFLSIHEGAEDIDGPRGNLRSSVPRFVTISLERSFVEELQSPKAGMRVNARDSTSNAERVSRVAPQ